MSETLYIRRAAKLEAVDYDAVTDALLANPDWALPDTTVFPSINKAKRESRRIQKVADGALGLGTVRTD